MPRSRRRSKRHTWEAQREAWEAIFDCGRDFFGELPAIGVPTDPYGKPDMEAARDAWLRFGPGYLATHPHQIYDGQLIWALSQFGEPNAD